MLEHIIVNNFMKHVEEYNILIDCQHGFQVRKNCETQLVTLLNDLASTLDKGIKMDIVVVKDFSTVLTVSRMVVYSGYSTIMAEGIPTFGSRLSFLAEPREWSSRAIHQIVVSRVPQGSVYGTYSS